MIDVRDGILTFFESVAAIEAIIENMASEYNIISDDIKFIANDTQYSPVLRFILADKKSRHFITQEYIWENSRDKWEYARGPARLEKLVKEKIKELEEKSLYI